METQTQRADARANRARILEAAQTLLRERGIDAEIKDIAERAGVGIGTLYRNFPTKDDLVIAIAHEMFGAIRQTLDTALAIDDPIDAIRQFLRGAMETLDRYGDLMEILHAGGALQAKEQFDFDAVFARIALLLKRGVDRGIFRRDLDTELAATLLLGSLHAEMLMSLRRTRSLAALTEGHLQLFLHGVECQSGA